MSYAHDGPFPMKPGASLNYQRVHFVTVAKSDLNGPKQPAHAVISSRQQLESYLHDITPIPNVDFSRTQLILVALGPKSTNGFGVEIVSIVHFFDRGKALEPLTVVSFEENDTGGPLDVVTYPYHLVETQILTGTTDFEPLANVSKISK